PKNVTPIPLGRHTTCWYFQPVARMTNSVTVAMNNSGRVRYEIFFVFSRCQGENPASGGVAEGVPVELELFITEFKNYLPSSRGMPISSLRAIARLSAGANRVLQKNSCNLGKSTRIFVR